MASTTMTTATTTTTEFDADQTGKLVLRLMLGLLILFHGVSKLIGGPGYVLGLMEAHGLPSFLAYGVYVGEVIAPIMLVVGIWTRVAALIVIVNMIFALTLVHTSQFLMRNQQGGYQLELQMFYMFSAVVVLLLGAGKFSVGGLKGRWN
jgi:putative oxidoreductase